MSLFRFPCDSKVITHTNSVRYSGGTTNSVRYSGGTLGDNLMGYTCVSESIFKIKKPS